MDTRLNYSQTIKQILRDIAEFYRQGNVDLRPLFDDSQKSYLLLKNGWDGNKYGGVKDKREFKVNVVFSQFIMCDLWNDCFGQVCFLYLFR